MAIKKFVKELVPDDSVPQYLYDRQVRRRIRYCLFRLNTEEAEGIPVDDIPAGLKKHYESSEEFDGWKNFGVTWDVDDNDPLVTVPRYESINEAWDRQIEEDLRANRTHTRKRQRQIKKESDGLEGNI